MHDRDALLPTMEPGAHDRHACTIGMHTWQRCDDSALGSHTTRPGHTRDKDVHATEEFCHDRDFFVVIDLSSSQKKKKKKTPGIWVVAPIK